MVINQDENFMKAYVLNPLMANNRKGGRTHCLYCDSKIVKGRTTTPLFFCKAECRAKGSMNISSLKSKATENDQTKYRKKRRGTTNTHELCAIWDVLRKAEKPQKASWVIETIYEEFGRKRWLKTNSNGLYKKLHYFDKEALIIDKSNPTMKYKAAKNIPFQEALSQKTQEWLQSEYDYNTSEVLKGKV